MGGRSFTLQVFQHETLINVMLKVSDETNQSYELLLVLSQTGAGKTGSAEGMIKVK